MSAIREFARRVAGQFQPEQIILFGSHAYGTPHPDSDVDILVVMPARNRHDQAVKIRLAVPAPFPMDLIVRRPAEVAVRLAEGESFLTEIVTKGKVLYEAGDGRVGAQGGVRHPRRRGTARSKAPGRIRRPVGAKVSRYGARIVKVVVGRTGRERCTNC
ncbi:MAG TPA: nucleotidyltransferase domain-containing protein [Gemmataceae bacterium]|nr:nucleotidyltransferase domain-containing protein [Gemmataceae bacterium]